MMYDLTRSDLDDLDAALLAHLLAVGEPLHVERKRDIPPAEKLAELTGSMANTDGGWAVLGVADDGTVIGLPPSRSDLQDEIRDAVRATLDPLPNFAARRVEYGGKEVGVLRVYRSEETPHVCTHKGAVYVRMPGGKRPIESRRELDELIARGRSSRADAEHRLATLSVALDAQELLGEHVFTEPVDREWVLSATPVGRWRRAPEPPSDPPSTSCLRDGGDGAAAVRRDGRRVLRAASRPSGLGRLGQARR